MKQRTSFLFLASNLIIGSSRELGAQSNVGSYETYVWVDARAGFGSKGFAWKLEVLADTTANSVSSAGLSASGLGASLPLLVPTLILQDVVPEGFVLQ